MTPLIGDHIAHLFDYPSEGISAASVICSSAGNHAQGVAIAAAVYKMKAVVVMASNATQSKVDATRAYGAEVVQHGTIWDEANEKAKQLCEERGLTRSEERRVGKEGGRRGGEEQDRR